MNEIVFSIRCSVHILLHFLGALEENTVYLLGGMAEENTTVFQPYAGQVPVVHCQRDGYINWVPLKVCLRPTIFQYVH